MADDWSEDIPIELIVGDETTGFIEITSNVPAELITFYAAHWSTVQLEAVIQFNVTSVTGILYYYLVAGLNPGTGFPLFATGWVDQSLVVHEGYIAELFGGILQTIYGNVTPNEIIFGANGQAVWADSGGVNRIQIQNGQINIWDAANTPRLNIAPGTALGNTTMAFRDPGGNERLGLGIQGSPPVVVFNTAGFATVTLDDKVNIADATGNTKVSLGPALVSFDNATDFTYGGAHQGRWIWDRGKNTTSQSGITSAGGQILQSDFTRTFINGRAYRIHWRALVNTSVAGGIVQADVEQGSNNTVLRPKQTVQVAAAAANNISTMDEWIFVNTSGHNITDFITVNLFATGANTVGHAAGATSPAYFTVDDIGPASDYSWAVSLV